MRRLFSGVRRAADSSLLFSQAPEERDFTKIEISCAIFSASWVLTCPAESKPNSRMIKTNMIGVILIAPSIIDKNRRGEQGEQNANQRTRDSKPEGNVPP